jgi:hypothetical protein
MKEMQKYSIQAKDGDIGAISDFLFDEKNWMMRYIVVDTGNWLPGQGIAESFYHRRTSMGAASLASRNNHGRSQKQSSD